MARDVSSWSGQASHETFTHGFLTVPHYNGDCAGGLLGCANGRRCRCLDHIHWQADEFDRKIELLRACWGFFDAVFEQKEYAEAYVLEKLAREMLDKDPALRAEFTKALADPAFAASATRRLDFFYRRSPWWDQRIGAAVGQPDYPHQCADQWPRRQFQRAALHYTWAEWGAARHHQRQ